MTDRSPSPRRLILLGSTGSIGVNTLAVIDHLNRNAPIDRRIEIVGLAAGRSATTLIEQARRFRVKHLAIADPAMAREIRRDLPNTVIFAGSDGCEKLVREVEATDVVAAIVGAAGLPATIAAAELGRRICLANKETLVAAGAYVQSLVRQHRGLLLPIDSEHAAVLQCLTRRTGASDHDRDLASLTADVHRIVLTASGGPFRDASKADMDDATVEQALNHPTWNMGPKITIDSATLMNKALEIVEAHWLFGLPGNRIDALVHPQSIVHSLVEFTDHSILAQLGPPDMRTPIQYALTYPQRVTGCGDTLDWSRLRTLSFEPPDLDRFPALRLAYQVIDAGGTAGAVFNAANEAAVEAFLERRIHFGRIIELVHDALAAIDTRTVDSLDTVLEADRQARAFVTDRLACD